MYVVNKRRRASEAVVHMPDCEKIHHQVEQDVRPEVHRETRVPAYIRFVANYMTVADAAVLFKEPVEDLVSDFAIEAISGGSEYQLEHNVPVDISRRELSAPAGSRVSVPRHPSARRRAK